MRKEFWKEVRVDASSSGCIRLRVPVIPGGVVELGKKANARIPAAIHALEGAAMEVWLEPDQAAILVERLQAALKSPLLEIGAHEGA